jgi:hypothetical protein
MRRISKDGSSVTYVRTARISVFAGYDRVASPSM